MCKGDEPWAQAMHWCWSGDPGTMQSYIFWEMHSCARKSDPGTMQSLLQSDVFVEMHSCARKGDPGTMQSMLQSEIQCFCRKISREKDRRRNMQCANCAGWGGHSGPGCGRINLSKCTKNQAKWGNSTLNIAFPKTRMIFNESPPKKYFWPFLHVWPCQGSLWAIGAKKRPAKRPNGHLPENRRYPKLPQAMEEIWSHRVGSVWAQ